MIRVTLEEWCKENNKISLLEEWHPTKNGELKPDSIAPASNKKVWWKCAKGHEWQAVLNNRANKGLGCPYCAGRMVIKGVNDLQTCFPEIAKEWHPTKNDELTPDNVLRGSNKKVWWKCTKGHEWQATVSKRTGGKTGCPYCSGHKTYEGYNDFKTWCITNECLYLLDEWNYEKNDISPSQIAPHSERKVWWKCGLGHEWKEGAGKRVPQPSVKGLGCPYCSNHRILQGFNDLKTRIPALAEEWDYEKNEGMDPTNVGINNSTSVWWKCQYGHEWKTTIHNRSKGSGCPKCSGQGTSLPEQGIAYYLEKVCKVEQRTKVSGKEIDIYLPEYGIGIEYDGKRFHTSKTRDKEKEKDEKVSNSGVKLIRIKESDQNSINDMVIFFDTDYLGANYSWAIEQLCHILEKLTANAEFTLISINAQSDILEIHERANRYFKERSLLALRPDLAKEWHPFRNGNLTPNMFSAGSVTKVWWRCIKGHEWDSVIRDRVAGYGCPICSGKRVLTGFNDLKTVNPQLSKEWNIIKNGSLKPTDFTSGSKKTVWWLCEKCGFEWKTSICNRAGKGTGCPKCKLKEGINARDKKHISNDNSLAENYPEIAKEWHPTKNGNMQPSDVAKGSGKKVWWQCLVSGNEYQAQVGHRTISGQGCPKCSLKRMVNSRRKNHIAKNGSLNDLCPDIAKEWHPTKNGELKPIEVARASHKSVWWKCSECGYEWNTVIYSRTCDGRGCPCCSRNQKKS